jgi:hypothetical protein
MGRQASRTPGAGRPVQTMRTTNKFPEGGRNETKYTFNNFDPLFF